MTATDIKNNDSNASPEWARAKYFKNSYGIGPAQLRRFSCEGLIRTSCIKRPGQTRGIRLFNVGDVNELINRGIEHQDRPQNERNT